jgi:hypothetical protein
MEVYYFDNNGKYMKMETEDQIIDLPLIVRKYPKFGIYTIGIGYTGDSPITHLPKKRRDSFEFYYCKFVCENFTGQKSDWKRINTCQFSLDEQVIVDGEIDKRIDFWFRKYCDPLNYLQNPGLYHKGHVCYWHDANIYRVNDLTIHTYGNCIVESSGVRDTLIYNHGNLIVR